MPRGKGAAAAQWDEDDFYDDDDDGYDDDEGGWEDEYDDVPAAKPPKKQPAAAPAKPKAPAAAAGASALARALCDPPPPRPSGKPQAGAKAKPPPAAKQGQFPVAPPPAGGGGGGGSGAGGSGSGGGAAAFDFSGPSPDDAARAAGPSAERRAVGVPLAPSRTPTVQAARDAQAATKAAKAAAAGGGGDAAAAAAAEGVAGLSLGGEGGGAQQRAAAPRRPLSEYVMEPALKSAVATAAAAERAGGPGAPRPSLHLVVLGHVDAGKSTLMGRALHDLGRVSAKEAHRNQRDAAAAGKASFAWAWALDERPEERARGVTVDVALARFATPRYAVTLLDAPGHRDFVANMVSGAAQADAALLVVDGSPGGFEAGFGPADDSSGASGAAFGGRAPGAGQTREHAQLARGLGVDQLAVVVTKLDTCGWSAARFDEVKGRLAPFLRACGYKDDRVQWLPASAPAGQNLTAAPTEPALLAWWRGPTLVEAIDAFAPHGRDAALPLRMPVHDVVRSKAGSLSVGGKLEAGALKPGTAVLLLPGGGPGTVKSAEVNGEAAQQLARAGDSADVALTGIDPAAAHAGSVLCHPSYPCRVAARFEARVLVLDVPTPLLRGAAATLHAHTAREEAVITDLVALLDGATGAEVRKRPRCLLRGQTALVEVAPARPVALEEYADLRALGRIALRDGGATLAVGVVTRVLEER